jgi:hypothetical protein
MAPTLILTLFLALSGGSALAAKEKPKPFFGERHWKVVRDFYNEQMREGTCPIGFAKKEDGCEPPRHARTWEMGKPLPANAIRFDLPPALVTKLGKPPSGHRYVRVVADVLLVSNRTKLVEDAIQDLGRR